MNKLFIGVVVVVVGGLVGWYLMTGNTGLKKQGDTAKPANQEEMKGTGADMMQDGQGTSAPAASGEATVHYTDNGFSPASVAVKKGTAVTFINDSSRGMWVASDVHPTHKLLPGFDELQSVPKGGSYTYTFAKVGTWTLHNHVYPTDLGKVVVTE